MAAVALVCLAVFLYMCYVYLKPKKRKLPPGPKGVPIFGNALQFKKETCTIQIAELGRDYGDAFSLKLFNTELIILNSYDLIKEALTSTKYATAFSGRPRTFVGEYLFQSDEIFTTYSEEWAALRKLVFRGLKTYGSNMEDVEELVQGEIKQLIRRIQYETGTSMDPVVFVSGYLTSVISMLITGRHLEQDHPQLKLLAKITYDIDHILDPATAQLLTWLPWIRLLPIGCGKLYQDIQQDVSEMNKHIAEDRLKSIDITKKKACFLDFMHQEKEKGNISEENVSGVMLDLLSAGTATTRTSLYSMFLVLASRPDIQRRIQEEIDEVVGRSRLPCHSDKSSMPYTQAVVWETFRLYPATLLTMRCTMEDVYIRDYVLPKDTQVFYNIWLVLHDEQFWKDPYVFNPSRFLDDTGHLLPPEHEKRHRMIAFGVGKRLCIGETLARLRIFLALVSVLQNFNLVPDPKHPLPNTDPRHFIAGILLHAPKYKLFFERRGQE